MDSVLVSGQARHHDDFGEAGNRGAMLRRCLDLVMARYPQIEITIGGTLDGLREFGLVSGAPLHVAKGAVAVGMLPLERSRCGGVVRRASGVRSPPECGRQTGFRLVRRALDTVGVLQLVGELVVLGGKTLKLLGR